MRDQRDDDLLRAIKAIGKVGGYDVKRVAWADDLKNRTLTVTLQGVSAGWVQEALDFEIEGGQVSDVDRVQPLEVVADNEMHVEKVTDPSDLTEKDETLHSEDGRVKPVGEVADMVRRRGR
jgi:hypothetical protein